MDSPLNIDLKRDKGLTIEWADGTSSYFSIGYLRRMSPSADVKELREQLERNPLTVLPSRPAGAALSALSAQLVGTFATRTSFSGAHSSGTYSWNHLREIDPANPRPDGDPA